MTACKHCKNFIAPNQKEKVVVFEELYEGHPDFHFKITYHFHNHCWGSWVNRNLSHPSITVCIHRSP